jgi:hypothetical protein
VSTLLAILKLYLVSADSSSYGYGAVLLQQQTDGDRSAAVPFIPTTYGQRHRSLSQRQSAATRASAEDIYDAAGSDAITVVYRYADVQRSVSPSRPSSSTTETPTDSGPVGKSVASRRHPFRTPVQTTGPHEPVKGGCDRDIDTVDRLQYTLHNRPNVTVFCTLPAREPRGRNTTRYIESFASCCVNKEHDIIV